MGEGGKKLGGNEDDDFSNLFADYFKEMDVSGKPENAGMLDGGGNTEFDEVTTVNDVENMAAKAGYHEVYQSAYKHLSLDEKIRLASTGDSRDLSALCFDIHPQVIQTILQNQQSGLTQARLIARYHHSGAGLDYLTSNPALAGDRGVRESIFRNPVSGEVAWKRCFRFMNLFVLHNFINSREGTEQSIAFAKKELVDKYNSSTPDVKANFIIRNEGRCLILLGGAAVNVPVAKIIMQRKKVSSILKRNLLRLEAIPPGLKAFLNRQTYK